MRKDLAEEIIHRNILTLQLNQIFLEGAHDDIRTADEVVGRVRLSNRRSGYSVAVDRTHEFHLGNIVPRGELFISFACLPVLTYKYIDPSSSTLDVVLD